MLDGKSTVDVDERKHSSPYSLLAVQQRIEIIAKVHKELVSMSVSSYPHGEPVLDSMEALVSNYHFDLLEDELLDIIFKKAGRYI